MAGPLGALLVPSLELDSLNPHVPSQPSKALNAASVSPPPISSASPLLDVVPNRSFPPLRNDPLLQASGPDAVFLRNSKTVVAERSLSPVPTASTCSHSEGSGVRGCCSPRQGSRVVANADCGLSPAKSWSQTVKGKGNFSFSSLKFFPPPLEAGLASPLAPPAEVLEQGTVIWGSTLVGMFQDKPPHFLAVDSIARKLWARFGLRNVAVAEKDIYFFTFDSVLLMEACLAKGPWVIKRNPIFLKRWSPGMALDSSSLKSIPMWISLVNVPIVLWTPLGLSWIASRIGKPILCDPSTARMNHLHQARICIEVGFDDPLPDKIPLLSGDKIVDVKIVYHSKPAYRNPQDLKSMKWVAKSQNLHPKCPQAPAHGPGRLAGVVVHPVDHELVNEAVEDASSALDIPSGVGPGICTSATVSEPKLAEDGVHSNGSSSGIEGLVDQLSQGGQAIPYDAGAEGSVVATAILKEVACAPKGLELVELDCDMQLGLESVLSKDMEVVVQSDRVEGSFAGSSLQASSGGDGGVFSDELGLIGSLSKAPFEDPSGEACISSDVRLAATGGSVLDVFDSINSFAILQDPEGSDVQGFTSGPPVEPKDEILVDHALDQTSSLKKVRFALAEAPSSAPRRRMLATYSDICHPIKFRRPTLDCLSSVEVSDGPIPGADAGHHDLLTPTTDGVAPEAEPASIIDPDLTPSPIARILKKYSLGVSKVEEPTSSCSVGSSVRAKEKPRRNKACKTK